jgi:DNA-binding GntR family transcriptional regulator
LEGEDGSSFERVYRGILRGLYEGRFVPGQRLVEPDLMRQFEVGRGTVREVLNRLSSIGIVSMVRHRGAHIRLLTRREVNEILDIVGALVGLGAGKAAEQIQLPGHAERLTEAYEMLRPFEWKDDFEGFVSARENFYRALIRISNNRELVRLFPVMLVHIMRLQLRHFDHAADSMQFTDYSQLTAAVLSGDGQRADVAGRLHVQHTIDSVGSLPDRAFAPEPSTDGATI